MHGGHDCKLRGALLHRLSYCCSLRDREHRRGAGLYILSDAPCIYARRCLSRGETQLSLMKEMARRLGSEVASGGSGGPRASNVLRAVYVCHAVKHPRRRQGAPHHRGSGEAA